MVPTKQAYYARWIRGEFGNRLRAWNTYEDLLESGYQGNVTIRTLVSSAHTARYGVPVQDVLKVIKEMGGSVQEHRFNESAPDDQLIIQGELYENVQGWYMVYNRAKCSMRDAMRNDPQIAEGLLAREILRHDCCPNSFDDIKSLLDIYPGHVIEFGVYACQLGDMPHRNTLIWEVRNY